MNHRLHDRSANSLPEACPGLRMTPQRQEVYRVLMGRRDHLHAILFLLTQRHTLHAKLLTQPS